MLPTFLIIGAAKSGTTSLWEYLRRHPQVYVAPVKEPSFFVDEIAWRKGISWYEDLFAAGGAALARGEASPTYTMYPALEGVPARIFSIVPHVKLIYLVRDPIERMRSVYVHRLDRGDERRPIADALLHDPTYVNVSRYALQLDQYLEHFSLSQFLFITSEDLREERSLTMTQVFEFIGVDPSIKIDTDGQFNRGADKRAMRQVESLRRLVPRSIRANARIRPYLMRLARQGINRRVITPEEIAIDVDLRRCLSDLVRPDVERLAQWMGPSFDGWGLLDKGEGRSESEVTPSSK